MRTPKYRAWYNGEMCNVLMIAFDRMWVGLRIEDRNTLVVGSAQQYTQRVVSLNDVVLMQCTGLKDKNGVEIYDGDVVSTEGAYNLVVSIEDGRTLIRWNDYCGFETDECEGLTQLDINEYELCIIGNIHENPELLEVI